MSRWLALADAPNVSGNPCDDLTKTDKTQPEDDDGGFVTYCQLSREKNLTSRHVDIDAFEERASIIEFDGGLTRREADDLAARSQGYGNVVEFRAAALSNNAKEA